MFSNDSDLLVHEPRIFHELPIVGQTKLRITDAVVSGDTVTSATGGFASLAAMDVAVLGEGAYPIAQVTDDQTLRLAYLPAEPGTLLTVRTFAPQRRRAYEQLLGILGQGSILSLERMRELETLLTLQHAYAAGVSILGDAGPLLDKSRRYQRAFLHTLRSAVIEVDADDDGRADELRRPGVMTLVRE